MLRPLDTSSRYYGHNIIITNLSRVDIVTRKHCGTCNILYTQVAKDTSVHKTIEKLKTRYLERDGQSIVVVSLLLNFSYVHDCTVHACCDSQTVPSSLA